MPVAQQVFVIRLWLECSGGASVSRGYVEHVASGERRYFIDLSDALEYVAARSRLEHDGTSLGNAG